MYNEKIFIISLISCVFLTGCGSEEEVILKTERKVSTQLIGASNHSKIICLIFVMQFGHLREPLMIMSTIPLSFIGIIWGLKFTGYSIG